MLQLSLGIQAKHFRRHSSFFCAADSPTSLLCMGSPICSIFYHRELEITRAKKGRHVLLCAFSDMREEEEKVSFKEKPMWTAHMQAKHHRIMKCSHQGRLRDQQNRIRSLAINPYLWPTDVEKDHQNFQ